MYFVDKTIAQVILTYHWISKIFYQTMPSCRHSSVYKSNIQSILEIHSEIKATDFFLFFWENQKIISVMPVCSIHRLQRKKPNGYIQSSDIYVHILVTEMSPNGIRSEKMTCILQVLMVNFCTRWPISLTLKLTPGYRFNNWCWCLSR